MITTRMKKRLIIYGVNYYPPKGGTSRVVENLVIQLKDHYSITVYCYKNPLAKDHIAGVNVVEINPFFSGSIGSLIYFFLSALHILFFGKADLINAHKTDCALFIPLLRLRFKVIATSHEAPYKRDKWNFIQRSYFRLAEWLFIHSANICTCISEPLSLYYEEKYGKKIYFIPNGINITDQAEYDYNKAESFMPPGASTKSPFILFSARRLMSTKGCHTMLQALQKLDYKGQVFITGELQESPYLQRLKKIADGLNVSFLGYVDPLNALLALVRRSTLFIFPSENEGMSVMLLEAASAGKPIIASAIPENRQIFSDKDVLYFETGNQDDLAKKISWGLNHYDEINMKSISAQNTVHTSYLWANIAHIYSDVFTKVLHHSGKG